MSIPETLTAQNVTRKYADQTVVDQVDLALEPGLITALLGPSGAGKSTLLRLFAGLERPDAGTVSIGQTILSGPQTMVPAEKRRIGLIFQDFALFPHLTAQKNIAFGLTDKRTAMDQAAEWLTKINLQHRADAYPHQLSGGEQQRIAIARALAPKPLAILMDEPFSGLDPALREDVRQTALAIIKRSQVPALLVTHDATEAMLSADHLVIMRNGKIAQQGSPETVYTNPIDLETALALGPMITVEGETDTQSDIVNTPFGPFSAPELPANTSITIGIRPEAVILDPFSDIAVNIVSIRRNGPLLQIRIEKDGFQADVLAPTLNPPVIGAQIGVRLDPAACVIFEPKS